MAAVQVEDVGETVLPLSLDGIIVGQEGMHDKVPEMNNELKVHTPEFKVLCLKMSRLPTATMLVGNAKQY